MRNSIASVPGQNLGQRGNQFPTLSGRGPQKEGFGPPSKGLWAQKGLNFDMGKGINTLEYFIYRSPSQALGTRMPEMIWKGSSAEASDLPKVTQLAWW